MNITILTDASFCGKTNCAGFGYWIASERGKLPGGGPFHVRVRCNNTAELMAICQALWEGVAEGLVKKGDSLLIQTDSKVAINWLKGRYELKKDLRQAKEAIAYFRTLCKNLKLDVSLRHVEGHSGKTQARYLANNACDKRARAGLKQAKKLFSYHKEREANAAQASVHPS